MLENPIKKKFYKIVMRIYELILLSLSHSPPEPELGFKTGQIGKRRAGADKIWVDSATLVLRTIKNPYKDAYS